MAQLPVNRAGGEGRRMAARGSGDKGLSRSKACAVGEGAWFRAAPICALVAILAVAFLASGCSLFQAKPRQKAEISNQTQFSEAETGVKASPRVTEEVEVAKGGGRYTVGKPYRVRGKWYKPRENPQYAATGMASWYGPNFHGRLTANGEIYNQYSLSAAHPTLPLPSYVRVTNLENGRSVMVRVNDRGPFAHGRIIDMSARAAKLLDFAGKGVAKVRVEYAGKARIDGHDDAFLMASYRGPDVPGIAPGASQPGTMIAMNEDAAPAGSAAEAEEIAGAVDDGVFTPPGTEAIYAGSIAIAMIPIPTQRPTTFDGIALDFAEAIAEADPIGKPVAGLQPLSFVAESGRRVSAAFAAIEQVEIRNAFAAREAVPTAEEIALSRQSIFITLGIFRDAASAEFVRSANSDLGLISVRRSWEQRGTAWEVRLMCAADTAPHVLGVARARGLGAQPVR
jgi:rare lipoprotein A